MLEKIGAGSIQELLGHIIPEKLRLKRPLDISALSEMELLREVKALSQANQEGLVCFAGGGVYDHFVPSAVKAVVSRPEFVTAYTPYQAEVAQGTLQVIYEFQTHVCRLTGMEVANASLYDGATAVAEAVLLAFRATRRDRAVVSETVNPVYREVTKTYLRGRDIELVTIPMKAGLSDYERIESALDDKTACLMVAQPNFFGLLEDADIASKLAHKVGGKLIMSVDPIAQALLMTPGEIGADIVIAEGQPLGMPLSFGGPLLGLIAARKELVRNLPGRIVGRTTDVDGKEGFVLTLQTREQHIRREKATSNICTNQALCATIATVYLTLMGKRGLKQAALLSAERAQQTQTSICGVEGYEPYFDGPFVREFPIRTPVPAQEVVSKMTEKGILAGVDAGRWFEGMDSCLIVAATEKRTTSEITQLSDGLKEYERHGVLPKM